jgi:hypothetical protein
MTWVVLITCRRRPRPSSAPVPPLTGVSRFPMRSTAALTAGMRAVMGSAAVRLSATRACQTVYLNSMLR